MANGQQRSNREVRKPKQPKIPPKSQSPFGTQVKQARDANAGIAKPLK